jgi:hypothetical protein
MFVFMTYCFVFENLHISGQMYVCIHPAVRFSVVQFILKCWQSQASYRVVLGAIQPLVLQVLKMCQKTSMPVTENSKEFYCDGWEVPCNI